jgi:hypothetical protein
METFATFKVSLVLRPIQEYGNKKQDTGKGS